MENAILKSAAERAEHLSQALFWYKKSLNQNDEFKKNFLLLNNELVACARENHSSKHVFFIAVGKSAQVAQLAVSMLVSVGILARFVHPTEAYHGDLGVVGKGDTVIIISNNGKSAELLQLLEGLQERQVVLFAITSKQDSPLAKAAQHILLIPPVDEMCPLTQAPITSTVTSLALCQLLVAATVEFRNYSIEQYAKNHPGGAIGKRIFLKADSLMIRGKDLPLVEHNSLFQHVVSVFTKFSKAAVLVVDGERFLGLIAEKDLRKAMEKYGPRVFELNAAEIMNPHPTIVPPGLLAIEALQIMNSKTPSFNILPVVDKNGYAVGLLRMLDFIAAGVC